MVPGPPSSAYPKLYSDDQLVDLPAAIYAIRGKAKESHSVSGTAGDDENAALRGLRPDERSLDLGQYVSVSPVTSLFCLPSNSFLFTISMRNPGNF